MGRIGSIKSKTPLCPSKVLHLMLPQQEGHDNSGFAMVMRDLYGVFSNYKDKPLLSMACTRKGLQMVEEYMDDRGFTQLAEWSPLPVRRPGLDVKAMPYYMFRNYEFPDHANGFSLEEKENLLLDVRLDLRKALDDAGQGYVYSFWPDTLTLKELGKPGDIAEYFSLWDENDALMAKNITVQCLQHTKYDMVRYAVHPFFLQGYSLCANGENTLFYSNKELQKVLHRGYIGFESDSESYLYSLHYVLHELKWPISYFKHVITPLSFREIEKREDRDVLMSIRQSLSHLETNGPISIIASLPDNRMITCCDSKKMRPLVIGRVDGMVAISSEVSGLNEIMPDRNIDDDIYPHEREVIVINDDLEVLRCKQ